MTGVIVNALAVVAGSLIGILFKKIIPEKLNAPIMTALGLCVVYIGISGALCGENTLILVGSMILGAGTGTLLDIDGAFTRLGDRLENRFAKGEGSGSFSKGFVSSSIIFCVGAMAVVGSINAGLLGDNTVLYTKSLLDGISSIFFAATMGIGVMFSALCILIYQGAIALLSGLLNGVLTESAINELSCAGNLIILAIGLNMLKITKIKIADLMPAIIYAPVIALIVSNL